MGLWKPCLLENVQKNMQMQALLYAIIELGNKLMDLNKRTNIRYIVVLYSVVYL